MQYSDPHRDARRADNMVAFLKAAEAALNPPYRVPDDADFWVIMDAVTRCIAAEGPQPWTALAVATNVGALRLLPAMGRFQRAGLISASGGPGREIFDLTAQGRVLMPILTPR